MNIQKAKALNIDKLVKRLPEWVAFFRYINRYISDCMKIIESSIIGKKSPEACEDGMVITDDFIAVIDGSTSKTPKHLNPDMKNGRYAMMLISEYIREELKADASVDDFCQGVTAYIYNKVYEKLGVEERLKEHPEERLTASVILYSWTRNEVWMVGDCQAIIDGKLYENGKPYEQEIARKRVELIEQGLSPAEARKQIEALLIEAMLSGQNQTYTVIDGFPIYREGVKVVSVSDSCSVSDTVPASDSVPCSDSVSASGTFLSLPPRLYWQAMAIRSWSQSWQRARRHWQSRLPTTLRTSIPLSPPRAS